MHFEVTFKGDAYAYVYYIEADGWNSVNLIAQKWLVAHADLKARLASIREKRRAPSETSTGVIREVELDDKLFRRAHGGSLDGGQFRHFAKPVADLMVAYPSVYLGMTGYENAHGLEVFLVGRTKEGTVGIKVWREAQGFRALVVEKVGQAEARFRGRHGPSWGWTLEPEDDIE